jgi:hypothetical protein
MNKLQRILCVGAGIITINLMGCLTDGNNEGNNYSGETPHHLTGIYLSKEDFKEDGKKEWGLVIEDPEGKYRKVYYLKNNK